MTGTGREGAEPLTDSFEQEVNEMDLEQVLSSALEFK